MSNFNINVCFWVLIFLAPACKNMPTQSVDNTKKTTTPVPPPPPNAVLQPDASPNPAETAAPLMVEEKETVAGDSPEKMEETQEQPAGSGISKISAATAPTPPTVRSVVAIRTEDFKDIAKLDSSIILDIRYATANNFTKAQIYDCPACLLRPEAAAALVKAHKALKKKGLGLKMFDCYRPRPYQQRLWDKVPNPDYVTPPQKGSMHSRGAAVDLTLVDANGKELDMGTPYDFFGVEAHTDNTRLPKKVLENRTLLQKAMNAAGFKGIRTEWWHFSFQGKTYELSDYVWPCK
jgi:D-alanyl-D-alanine dipeptidase